MPALRPAVFRARYHFCEVAKLADLAALIDRIAARGTHGLFLKAPDTPEIAAAVDRMTARGVPVVTLVTDIANCRRAVYVGMDNRAAGETAAYLIGEWLGTAKAKILTTLSSNRFRGEEEREIGFRRALRTRYPKLGIVESQRRPRHRRGDRRTGSKGSRRQPGHRRGLFDRGRQPRDCRSFSGDVAPLPGVHRP